VEELICYFNGQYMKESEVKIGLWDHVFVWGGLFDTARTYNHVPLFWKEHVDRLFQSCRAAHIDPGLTPEEIHNISLEVFKRNKKILEPQDDFLVVQRITRGSSPNIAVPPRNPTVLINNIYISPLYEAMAGFYQEGIHLVVANTKHPPPQCLDTKIKHSCRLGNYSAEVEAHMVDPKAFALMLDINGFIAEGPRYNFFMVKDGKLLTPRRVNILAGITREVVLELAKELNIECAETDLCVYDVYNADELFITATSFTIHGVAKFNERVMEKPVPGPVTKRLFSAFSEKVGYDLVQRVLDYAGKG